MKTLLQKSQKKQIIVNYYINRTIQKFRNGKDLKNLLAITMFGLKLEIRGLLLGLFNGQVIILLSKL